MRVIERSTDLLGEWAGVNEFRLMPDDAATPMASSVQVATVAENGVTLAYAWIHPSDGPQEGFLLVFDGEHTGQAGGVWLDSWHQAPQPMLLTGTHDRAGIHLTATYGEGWDWIIRVGESAGTLSFSMENQGPDIDAYAAMAGVHTRAL